MSEKPRVLCAGGVQIVSVEYAKPGHPKSVHADGSLCDHPGGIRIAPAGKPAEAGD